LIVILIFSFTSLFSIIFSIRKENYVESFKKVKPSRYCHNNREKNNNRDDDYETIDNSIDFYYDPSVKNDKIIMNHLNNYIMNTIDSVNDLKNINLLREKTVLHRLLWEQLFGTEIYTYDHILNSLIDLQNKNLPLVKLFNKVHNNLYSWAYGKKFLAIDELLKSYHGRGIVICTGNFHFKFAHSTIDILINLIKTKLPIEVFYNGKDDLTEEKKKILQAYPNVYLSNIEDYFNNDIIKCRKWAIKPFAMLASRFKEVILIDADAIFIHDPVELFKSKGYQKTGTLFFRDRTLSKSLNNDSLTWFKEWAKDPLTETKKSRFWNDITIHEMDSSTVVMNKDKVILGLLSVCKLNEFSIRENMVYRHVHGDKETFWMGFDMARQHYYMSEQPISFIGSIKTESSLDLDHRNNDEDEDNNNNNNNSKNGRQMLCGHIAHSLENGRILFWNGHLVKDKAYNSTELLDFNFYIVEKEGDDNDQWTTDPVCYYINSKKEVIPLPEEDQVFIDMIKEREYHSHIVLKKL